MNTNQVDCFLEAAKRLSFSGAAAELYLSPQAVSKQVIALERELNTRLFDRNGPRLTLTETGVLYKRLFEGQARRYAFLLEDIRLHQLSLSMSLRIGVSEWLDLFGPFGEGFRSFFAQHPHTGFSLSCHDNNELLSLLLSGEVDCAFFSGAQQPDRRDLTAEAVASEDIVLFAPADLGDGPVEEDCFGLPMLMTLSWNWIRTEYRLLGFRERLTAKLTPPELVLLPNYPSLLTEMNYSRGVTLAGSRFTPFARMESLRGHPLGITDDVMCLWRRDNENPLLQPLADHLRQAFGKT
jgi:DNA-binding transcriptional LysR family regulator